VQRGIDIIGASVALLLATPVLAVTAIAIRLSDGGPVIFRQQRVGKDLRPFDLLKVRSMVVDAEARLAGLVADNERTGGPLFKLDDDPRITRVGRFIRATSIDELPQLVNVLRGEMSLVGPRPALPSEVAAFDEATLVRQQVRPGVTGLWQVEARDNPSFTAYQYLDTFYVENQSFALDCAILIATFRAVWRSCWRALSRGRRAGVDAAVETPAPQRNRRAPLAPRINVAGVEFDAVDFGQATDAIVKLAKDGRRHHVVTGNVDHLMLLRRDPEFRRAYEMASLRVADGSPVVWLSKLIGTPLPERVTGSDLFPLVCERAQTEGLSIGVLGGREEGVPRALARLSIDYPNLRVAGFHCPPEGFEDDPELSAEAVAAVNEMQPDLLFVCLGAPKQERWWARNHLEVGPTVALHFGAAVDFYAGVVQRAPALFQRAGLEWLYRVLREPGRMWRRYLVRDMRFLAVMARVTLQARLVPGAGRHLRAPS
jgi:exopolysaccharide biosynthesis WecB/TagA/CpsF family protein